jgi:hypothetical protein
VSFFVGRCCCTRSWEREGVEGTTHHRHVRAPSATRDPLHLTPRPQHPATATTTIDTPPIPIPPPPRLCTANDSQPPEKRTYHPNKVRLHVQTPERLSLLLLRNERADENSFFSFSFCCRYVGKLHIGRMIRSRRWRQNCSSLRRHHRPAPSLRRLHIRHSPQNRALVHNNRLSRQHLCQPPAFRPHYPARVSRHRCCLYHPLPHASLHHARVTRGSKA